MRIPGVTFSWKRAAGLSALKGRASRALGVPLTRYGRQRKLGGCAPVVLGFTALAWWALA